MRLQQVIGSLAAFASLVTAVDLTGYEYVVVGSGAGGGYILKPHGYNHVMSNHLTVPLPLVLPSLATRLCSSKLETTKVQM
jgi:hypothetical protein